MASMTALSFLLMGHREDPAEGKNCAERLSRVGLQQRIAICRHEVSALTLILEHLKPEAGRCPWSIPALARSGGREGQGRAGRWSPRYRRRSRDRPAGRDTPRAR